MIYVLEDDKSIRELVIYSLKNLGFEVLGFEDPDKFWLEMKQNKPKLVILDIMLPKEDGISILKKIRSSKTASETPVILLTAKGSEYDKVVGLDAGADDYIAKPFGVMEFIARVKRLISRTQKPSEAKLSFESIEVDIPKHLVFSAGQEVVLTIKEFDTLVLLLRSQNIVHSRESILSEVWGYDYLLETRTVDAHIMSLRKKLGKNGKYIKTIRGLGYKVGNYE